MPFVKGHAGGPGRPRKADQNKGAITKAEKQIRDRLPEIIDSMILLSLGVQCTDRNIVTGETIVYDKPPDRAAAQYLIDRIMGKPTERKEHTFPDKPLHEMTEEELRAIAEA